MTMASLGHRPPGSCGCAWRTSRPRVPELGAGPGRRTACPRWTAAPVLPAWEAAAPDARAGACPGALLSCGGGNYSPAPARPRPPARPGCPPPQPQDGDGDGGGGSLGRQLSQAGQGHRTLGTRTRLSGAGGRCPRLRPPDGAGPARAPSPGALRPTGAAPCPVDEGGSASPEPRRPARDATSDGKACGGRGRPLGAPGGEGGRPEVPPLHPETQLPAPGPGPQGGATEGRQARALPRAPGGGRPLHRQPGARAPRQGAPPAPAPAPRRLPAPAARPVRAAGAAARAVLRAPQAPGAGAGGPAGPAARPRPAPAAGAPRRLALPPAALTQAGGAPAGTASCSPDPQPALPPAALTPQTSEQRPRRVWSGQQ